MTPFTSDGSSTAGQLSTCPHSLRSFLRRYAEEIGTIAVGVDMLRVLIAAIADGLGIILLALLAGRRSEIVSSSGHLTALMQHLSFLNLVLAFVAMFVVRNMLAFWRDEGADRSQQQFMMQIRERAFRSLTQARWGAFYPRSFAEIEHVQLVGMEKIRSGLEALHRLPATLCFFFTTLLVVAAALPWPLGLGALAITGVAIAMQLRNARAEAAALNEPTLAKQLTTAIHTLLGALKLYKSHGAEQKLQLHFSDLLRTRVAGILERSKHRQLRRLLSHSAVGLALATVFYLGETRHFLTHAQMILIALLLSRLALQMRTLQRSWIRVVELPQHFFEMEKFEQELRAKAEPPPGPKEYRIPLQHALTLEHVTFGYEDQKDVLQDLSLELKANTLTVIVGPSGAGKTTLLDILVGLNPPKSGRMVIDGLPLAEADLARWRRSIGYVPQDPSLLHGTIRENLTWLHPEATESELRVALEVSCSLAFIEELPDGLDTIVGDRGMRLSGGQRQRLALARAILPKPSLLLLDEATSALDTQTEQEVAASMCAFARETTIVAVTHRQPLVLVADQIISMDTPVL